MMKKLIMATCLWLSLSACYYDKEQVLFPSAVNCSNINAKFSSDIVPIVQSKCSITGCHDAGSTNKGGPFTNYSEIKAKASIIKSQVLSGAMPQGTTLSASQIQMISCWVDNGSLNN